MRLLLLHLYLQALLHSFSGSTAAAAAYDHSKWYTCDSDANYTTNSTFESNLKLLLTSLTSLKYSSTNFTTNFVGSDPDRTYGLFLCRGDVAPADCEPCIQSAAQDALSLCHLSKQATIWYDDCELRYDYLRFFGHTDNSYDMALNNGNSTTPDGFVELEGELLDRLTNYAAYNSSAVMFATGTAYKYNTSGVKEMVIYGLVQCTRDLSNDTCNSCLQQIRKVYRGYGWETNQGGRVFGKSCSFRYESYSFFQGDPTITFNQSSSKSPATPPHPSGAATPLSSSTTGKGIKKSITIVIPVAVGFTVVLVLIISILYRKRLAKKNHYDLEDVSTVESLLFDLSVLKVATDNFADSRKLGQGGFGAVYKGTLPNGEDIAVKRLSASSRQGIEELKNELVLVAKLQHKNLVRLRGVCLEEEEKLLVYEYVPNRSLDNILFDPVKNRQLNWGKRFEIIWGIARGLLYLHEETNLKVIHRDLKASNILLDADMNPKISDFGLARFFKEDATQEITERVVGTFGYMAPEYARLGHFSVKQDVYSFGILVLEIVSSKKNGSFEYDSEYSRDILSYAWEHWKNGTAMEIVDPSLGENYSRNEVMRCIQIALLCAQEAPANRPLMSWVFLMLQSPTVPLQEPLQPRFIAGFTMAESPLTSKQSGSSYYNEELSRTLTSPLENGLHVNQFPSDPKEEECTIVHAFKRHTS